MFACLVLLAVIKYRQGSIGIEKREWDLQTVTASDYTLEISLTMEQVYEMRRQIAYERFMPYEAEGLRLKLWVVKEVEAELNRLSDGNGGKVGAVDFTYHNSWLIDMLKEKGDLIKWQEWEKLNYLNKEMTRKIHEDMAVGENAVNDPENAKPCLLDPISAFVSMETEEAYNFLATKESGEMTLGNAQSTIEEALEPTNILWENYDMDLFTQAARFTVIILVTCFILFITFCVSFQAKAMEKDLIGKYDNSLSCSEVSHIYSAPQLQ